jgi:hypothetical protein
MLKSLVLALSCAALITGCAVGLGPVVSRPGHDRS